MRKPIKTLIALLPSLLMLLASCSDDDKPTETSSSLVCSYIEPAAIEVSEYTQGRPTAENQYLGPTILIKGEEISLATSPTKFMEISKTFCDTAYSSDAKGFWPDSKRDNYLSKPLLGLKIIAADDSWGSKYPKGSDVSALFSASFISAQKYINSGYQDATAITSKGETIDHLSDWKPEYGNSVYFNISLTGPNDLGSLLSTEEGVHDVGTCKGHDYIIIATFPDGTVTSKVFKAWCPWKAS